MARILCSVAASEAGTQERGNPLGRARRDVARARRVRDRASRPGAEATRASRRSPRTRPRRRPTARRPPRRPSSAGSRSSSASTPIGWPASRRVPASGRRSTTSSPRRTASTSGRSGRRRARRSGRSSSEMKALWIEGNPYYERVEGIVAGTPSLAEYDVILDAGSSAAEDPESAVPFDLELPGRHGARSSPGNLFNLTEGALWGTLPEASATPGTPADLDGDGEAEFGEVLPDPRLPARRERGLRQVREGARRRRRGLGADSLGRLHGDRRDGADDERVLRPVEGVALRRRATRRAPRRSTSSPASPTSGTSSPASRSSTTGVEPAVAEVDEAQAAQTGRELADLRAFIARPLRAGAGRRHGSRRSRPTRSGPRRRSARRRSPGRSRRRRRSSVSRSSSSRGRAAALACGARRAGRRARRARPQPARPATAALAARGRPADDARRRRAGAHPRRADRGTRASSRRRRRALVAALASSSGERALGAALPRASSARSRDEDAARFAAARAGARRRPSSAAAYREVLASDRGRRRRRGRSAGCSCASSGRRRASPAPEPTRRSRSTSLADGQEHAAGGARGRPRRLPRHLPGAPADRARDGRRGARARIRARASPPRAALARGYFAILEPSFRAPARRRRGRERAAPTSTASWRPRSARDAARYARPARRVDAALAGFRAAPLSREEEIRRAGQFLRFLALVPVEYGRGVADGRVTLAFEIQEAITFRDGAAQAFADLESVLAKRDAAAIRRIDDARRRARRRRSPQRPAASGGAPRSVEAQDERGARPRRGDLPGGVEGRRRRRRLRRHPHVARPRRRRRSRRRVRRRPSRRGSRPTRSSSSGPSSGCAGSPPISSSAPRVSSGTGPTATRASRS